MTGTPTSAPARVRTVLPGIEGLRGVAAVAVLLYHVQRQLARPTTDVPLVGEVAFFSHGVTLFFVLSGFLLFCRSRGDSSTATPCRACRGTPRTACYVCSRATSWCCCS